MRPLFTLLDCQYSILALASFFAATESAVAYIRRCSRLFDTPRCLFYDAKITAQEPSPSLKMLSIPHIIVIFVVALVVFGPEKLPELARNLGKVMAEFRRHTTELRSTFEGHLRDLEREADSRKIGGASTAPVAPAAPPPQTLPQPVTPTPGTVPSDAPNAAAIAAAAPNPAPPEDPASPAARKHPGDDPFLQSLDFAEPVSPGVSAPSESDEKAPERVTDGDSRPV